MNFADALGSALTAVRANVLRSVLTALGIIIGVAAVIVSSIIGGLIGLTAGYFRRSTETVTLFGADVLMAFPTMLLAASIVAFTDSRGLLTVVLAIALIYLGPTIRVVRALTLTISNRDFVLSARSRFVSRR
mgnify:CR=1 FL=1